MQKANVIMQMCTSVYAKHDAYINSIYVYKCTKYMAYYINGIELECP